MKKTHSSWESLKRMLRYRLIIPILRSPHPPEYKARGVAVGMAWAMTPLVGIQMYLVFMTWLIGKKIFKWNFSLPLGLAYTWVTNVFTLVPFYYAFYATGQWMMSRPIAAFDNLKGTIDSAFNADFTFVEKWTFFFKMLLQDWGVAMAVGCLPWVFVWSIASYYCVMRFEKARLERRNKKQKEKHA